MPVELDTLVIQEENMRSGILRVFVFSVLLCSCAGQYQADVQSAGDQNAAQADPAGSSAGQGEAFGTIQLVHKSILHNENELETINDIFENDALSIKDGGEGILELVDKLRMRIFNTTRLGGITITEAPGSPLSIRIFLERGGFTGQFSSLEGETKYETPGGAVIRIQGTHFLVVYDPESGVTTAGNFEGSVTIESGGSGPVEVSPGTIRQALPNEAPGPEIPLQFTQETYEVRARDLQDPVEALDSLGQFAGQPQGGAQPPSPAQNGTEPPSLGATQPPDQNPAAGGGPPTAEVIQNAFCRTGPSQVFEAEDSFVAGVRLNVDGRLANSSWWRVKAPDGKSCWISANLISLSGDLDSVPVLASPPTPAPVITDTPTPTASHTPTETEYAPDLPPPAPDLYSPENYGSIQCGPYYTISVTLSWSEVSDNDGIFAYEYELIDVASGIVISAGSFNTTSIDVSVDCSYNPAAEYRWHVRAIDNAMNTGPWSEDGYFYAQGIG